VECRIHARPQNALRSDVRTRREASRQRRERRDSLLESGSKPLTAPCRLLSRPATGNDRHPLTVGPERTLFILEAQTTGMKSRGTLRLATRGSRLARRQAESVKSLLEDRRYDVELVTVDTTGDQIRDELIHRLGKTGAFVRELDERVLEGELDGAIHSMKDMPTEQPDELVTAAVPERGPPGDVLLTPDGISLEELPNGAIVGTSSLRRRAQLLSARPDLTIEPLRGNIDTRLEKLLAPTLQAEYAARGGEQLSSYKPSYDDDIDEDPEAWLEARSELEQAAIRRTIEDEYDAIVLAAAGLERSGLGRNVSFQPLSTGTFVPAPGQGALAITSLNDGTARELNDAIDHPRTRVETTVERILLAELGGGCIAPIGIYGVVQGEYVHAHVQVYDRDGQETVTATQDLPIESYPEAARTFASSLADRGAATLIATARKEADETATEKDTPEESDE